MKCMLVQQNTYLTLIHVSRTLIKVWERCQTSHFWENRVLSNFSVCRLLYQHINTVHTDISNAHINNKDTHLMVSPYHSGTMLDLLELKTKEMVKTTGVKTCKAPVKSSPPTNQHSVSFTGRMSFLSPNQQCQSTEGKPITIHGLDDPKLTWGLPTLSLTTNSSWLPWGGLPCRSSDLWCQ